jgi:hypothetical protein
MPSKQKAIEILLASATNESFNNALKVYTDGAFSKSVAKVTLSTPLTSPIASDTQITGANADGSEVVGKAYAGYSIGDSVIEIQYKTLDTQSNYVGCQVGANPNPNTAGCFAPSGSLSVTGVGSLSYSYDPLTENENRRTIQGFSTDAEEKMYRCTNCPYSTYEKFYDYCKSSERAALSNMLNENFLIMQSLSLCQMVLLTTQTSGSLLRLQDPKHLLAMEMLTSASMALKERQVSLILC